MQNLIGREFLARFGDSFSQDGVIVNLDGTSMVASTIEIPLKSMAEITLPQNRSTALGDT